MASVHKPAGRRIYRIKFKDQHGNERVESSGCIDKRVAQGLAHMIEKDAERIRNGLLPEQPARTGKFLGLTQADRLKTPVSEAIDAYIEDLRRRDKAAETLRHRGYKLRRAAKVMCWGSLADITAESVTRYLSNLRNDGRAPATTNAYQDSLSAFLSWCVDQGWLERHPISGKVRRATGTKSRPYRRRAFLPEELRAFLAVAPRHRDRYLVAALSGLRFKELHMIEKRDVDLEAKVWRIRPEVDKTGRNWVVPILPDLVPELARIVLRLPEPTSRLFPKTIGNGCFDDHLRKAKLLKIGPDGRRLNFHSLRYFFCTLLAKRLPIQVVQRLMRHADIRRTVNLYMDLGLDDLFQEVAKLPSLFNPDAGTAGGTSATTEERKAK
jgi:integrase